MNLKLVFNKCKLYPCIMCSFNTPKTMIISICVNDKLEVGDELFLLDTMGLVKKEFATWEMSRLEDIVDFAIVCDLTNMTLNISQPYIISII